MAVAAVVGVAAYFVPSNAASVNGTAISRQALNDDLGAIASSPTYQCYLQAQLELAGQNASDLFPVTGAGKLTGTGSPPTYNNSFVRFWLSQMSDEVLVSQLLAARHVPVTPADLAFGKISLTRQITAVLGQLQSESGASCGVTATGLLGSLPPSFVNEQVQFQASQDLLSVHLAGFSLSTNSLERYYRLHSAEFDTECISYVGYGSKDAAGTARSQIEGGTPIANTGTVTQIGCGPQIAITSLPATVVKLPVGSLSQPVSEGTGAKYALLFVTARKATPFARARTTVAQVLLDAGSARTEAVLKVAGARADVAADPRYGLVRPATVDLAAPASPATSFVPDPCGQPPARPAGPVGEGSLDVGGRLRHSRGLRAVAGTSAHGAGAPARARITVVGLGPGRPRAPS